MSHKSQGLYHRTVSEAERRVLQMFKTKVVSRSTGVCDDVVRRVANGDTAHANTVGAILEFMRGLKRQLP